MFGKNPKATTMGGLKSLPLKLPSKALVLGFGSQGLKYGIDSSPNNSSLKDQPPRLSNISPVVLVKSNSGFQFQSSLALESSMLLGQESAIRCLKSGS